MTTDNVRELRPSCVHANGWEHQLAGTVAELPCPLTGTLTEAWGGFRVQLRRDFDDHLAPPLTELVVRTLAAMTWAVDHPVKLTAALVPAGAALGLAVGWWRL